ncbi:hypothetical protein LINGRAHAP2_LOCUS16437 [Linum grandiflorum]
MVTMKQHYDALMAVIDEEMSKLRLENEFRQIQADLDACHCQVMFWRLKRLRQLSISCLVKKTVS